MSGQRIFGCSHGFVEREQEFERIVAAAHAGTSLSILAAPGVGASELLRQAYDELFLSDTLIPFYFELKASDRDAAAAAKRFAYEFLVQAVAHARHDPQLTSIAPSLDEIARIAPAEFVWVDGAVEAVFAEADARTLLRTPARARGKVALLTDGLDRVRHIREGHAFFEAISSMKNVSVIVSGRRRMMYGRLPFEQLRLDPLSVKSSASVVEAIARHREVEITEATRDLIAVQAGGSTADIDALLADAADKDVALTDFSAVEFVYTESIFGGRIARYLRDTLLRPLPRGVDPSSIVRALADTFLADPQRVPTDQWRRALRDLDDRNFGRTIRHLHVEEVISAGDGTVSLTSASRSVSDYIRARAAILDSPEKRAVTVGRAMQHNIAAAPRLMTEFYRSNAAIGVKRLLDELESRRMARAAIDYGPFKRQLKGQDDNDIIAALQATSDTIDLPRIAYTADAAAFYPPLAELCDSDRAAVGLTDSGYAWFVAEIDSKLEADAATAEFWCDRLEMAAIASGSERYEIWLIAPEGFADEAMHVLSERNAFGSSRKQIELLRRLLVRAHEEPAKIATAYEITVPMGDDGELAAVRTLNEIAETHEIPAKPLTQIKTALVEGLINAAEHSLSPDRKTELRFEVTAEQITITIQNRGLRLTNHMLSQIDDTSERRGWGLRLIRELMDEVRVEPTDDGTRLVMVKRFGQA